MSEPKSRASRLCPVVPGVWHWTVHDDRIDFRSEAFAVETERGLVAIDPLPVADSLEERLVTLHAICITGGFHQRAAWSFRRRLGVPVFAPDGARDLVERPDRSFRNGDRPAPGLTAEESHGPTNPHYLFRYRARGGVSVVFCGDLLMRGDDGVFRLVPDDHQQDTARTRRAVATLLELPIDVLCPAHGAPQIGGVEQAIRRGLEDGS